jgi:hypothetical protein
VLTRPEIAALRGDDAPQRRAQQALHDVMAGWRGEAGVAEVLRDLAAFAAWRPLSECPALSALFDDDGAAATALAGRFVAVAARGLADWPLAHLPPRHFHDDLLSTLVLGREGNVTLSLVAMDGAALAARPQPTSAGFWPGEAWEAVLAGSGEALLVDARDADERQARLVSRSLALAPGRVICRDAARQALIPRAVSGTLVSLRLQRRRPEAGVAREYDLATGRLVHQAAGNPRDSRIELMIAMLARMKRREAAPLMADIACGEGSAPLRWQALRECLALDTAAGFAALCRVAGNAADPLAVPAGALRAQLIEAHPRLAEIA